MTAPTERPAALVPEGPAPASGLVRAGTAAALVVWAVASFGLALLPEGVGGFARALNAVVFFTLGPGAAIVALLIRKMPPVVAVVVALGGSLSALVLLSEGLLILGVWAPSRVAGLLALLTVALAVVPLARPRWVQGPASPMTLGERS
jgi:hypothetical protein